MSSSIVPSSQLPREEITAYLVGQGYAPEVAAWKYFDDEFNQGRSRGWAWVKDGRVAGFIGQAPFEVGRGSQRIEARWLCDWSIADYESNRGAGVRLFKRALQDGLHFVLGGNANSLGPMEKMASRTRHAADTEMRLFLRAGAILERLPARVPLASALSRGPLGSLPLPRKKSARSAPGEVSVQRGIAPELAPLLASPEGNSGSGFRALYDYKYLSWQIGRCPTLDSWTLTSPRVGAILWHPKSSPKVWRAALWTSPSAPPAASSQEARGLLQRAASHALAHGGREISLVASRSDEAEVALLRECGFSATKTARPLFVYDGPQPEAALEDLGGLNFIAADLSYRF